MTDLANEPGGQTVEATATRPGFAFKLPTFDMLKDRSDIALAVSMVCILVVLLLPMPTWMLDFSLAVSITLSVVILMTVLFVRTPLELTARPIGFNAILAVAEKLAVQLQFVQQLTADGFLVAFV
jgi:flagellar biosynthesis protein FlhA